MISPEKLQKALEAIQDIFIVARLLAYKNESHARIAALLDHGEYLPGLMLEKRDTTAEFATYLEGVAQDFPECLHVLEKFSGEGKSEN